MIIVREMTIDDFYLIKDILIEEFDDFWNENVLKGELESKFSKYFVACNDKEIVGFAGILITPDMTEITNIVTKKIERGKGIATLLLDKLIDKTRELKKEYIGLEVNEKNDSAKALYNKFGFEIVGMRKAYYNGKDDAIIMNKKV